jgi:1,4-alpha-glucan branching enzyme
MAEVRFEIVAPAAHRVFLAGDFNDWDPAGRRMIRTSNGEGRFVSLVELSPGRYEYRYVVDGVWTCCPQAPRVINPCGSENSVVDVEARDGQKKRSAKRS